MRAAASLCGNVRACGGWWRACSRLADAVGRFDAASKQILNGPGTSHWLKNALTTALDRDPVDAVNDAELLAMVLEHRADQINTMARAALDARDVIKRAQNNGG